MIVFFIRAVEMLAKLKHFTEIQSWLVTVSS